MVVTSKFDSKGIKGNLVTFLVAALMLVGSHLTFARKREIIISLIVVSIAEVVALLIWAIRLKVITVVDQGFEVRRICFPFLKRFYRFAEFDFYVIEQNEAREGFYLLSQGKRIVSFSSKEYENYEELKSLLSVVGTKEWGTDDNRAVDSVLTKKLLAGVFFSLILMLFLVSAPIFEYIFDGQVTLRTCCFAYVPGLFFLLLLIYTLYAGRRLTIWRGNIEIRSLLCPWKVRCYSLRDFDYALEVFTPGQYGSDEVSLWLIRDNKLVLSISQDVYANYDVLTHAIGIKPAKTVTMQWNQKLRYRFGKTIQI